MTSKLLGLTVLILFSCSRVPSHDGKIMEDAKWHFYSYAASLNGYTLKDGSVDPLACDLKRTLVKKMGKDTIEVYFLLYYKDTLNICGLMPLGLVGVSMTSQKIYLPIYHMLDFDPLPTDSAHLYMQQHETFLLQRIKSNGDGVVHWLKEYAENKKML